MNAKQTGCPRCGHAYPTLYRSSHSVCPACHAEVRTDLWTVRAIETVVGIPALWFLAIGLRSILHDATGVISYALLIIPAWLMDAFVARRFVTATVAQQHDEHVKGRTE